MGWEASSCVRIATPKECLKRLTVLGTEGLLLKFFFETRRLQSSPLYWKSISGNLALMGQF